uniref:Uncharacterized protein n=1 Tax=Glycine max TaxID=3847 RepID=C6T0Z2_SOYBN|nr:unknown [Glycine max]
MLHIYIFLSIFTKLLLYSKLKARLFFRIAMLYYHELNLEIPTHRQYSCNSNLWCYYIFFRLWRRIR